MPCPIPSTLLTIIIPKPYFKGIEIPKRRRPEAKAPKIKYFSPASVEYADSLLKAAKTYKHKLCNSIAKYTEIKSKELHKSIKPKTLNKINKKYSKELTL